MVTGSTINLLETFWNIFTGKTSLFACSSVVTVTVSMFSDWSISVVSMVIESPSVILAKSAC
jgi:hypothetical protein